MNKDEFQNRLKDDGFRQAVIRHNKQSKWLASYICIVIALISYSGRDIIVPYGSFVSIVFVIFAGILVFSVLTMKEEIILEKLIKNPSTQDIIEYKYSDKKFNTMFWVLGVSLTLIISALYFASKLYR